VKPHLWLIRTLGVLIPERLRADWRQEWEAELQYREELLAEWDKLDWRNKLDLLRRSLGAFVDALWLQKLRWEDEMIQDVRYGVRMLMKSPGFTAVAVLSLALGIGANTAIFSLIDALMLRPLPVREPRQLVTFEQVFPDGRRQYNFSFPDFERFQGLTQSLSGMSATAWPDRYNATISGAGGGVSEGLLRVSLVTGNFFSLLGVNARMGRAFTEEDDRAQGGHPVMVISDAYWEQKLARAADVIGRTITLNRTTFTIIGVMPRGFSGDWVGRPTDVWVPVAMAYQVAPEFSAGPRGANFQYKIIARLKPGVTIEQAQAAGQILHQQIVKDPPANTGVSQNARFQVVTAATGYSPQREFFAQPLAILMLLVAAVLLIACANLANLLLARGAARRHELAVRMALGAGRTRIVRQLLTEGLLLSLMGGTLGLLFAVWGTGVLAMFARSGPVGSVSYEAMSVVLDLRPNGRMLAFTVALCLLTVLLFGLAPAFRGSKIPLTQAMTGRSTGAGSSERRFGMRKLLVIVQVALSFALLTGATLFVRTLRNLRSEDLGLDREHVLLVWTLPGQTELRGAELSSLFWTMQERISSLPGVASASASVSGLLTGDHFGPAIRVEGSATDNTQDVRADGTMSIGPRFFETIGQPLLQGRDFARADADPAARVVIVIETLARRFFGSESPIGRRLISGLAGNSPSYEIVGVVKDAKYRTPRESSGLMTYWPYVQGGRLSRLCLVIRATGNPASIAASVRQELRNIAPNLPVLKIDTVEEQLDALLFQERFIASLSTFFGVLAVLLACIGLYGVMSYAVARRTGEIGIRLALGSTPAGVLRLVLRESLWLVSAGIVIGMSVSFALMRLASTRLYGVRAADPLTIIGAALLMITVTALAALLPARRAARVDPLVALRHE
jgi:predicted permease